MDWLNGEIAAAQKASTTEKNPPIAHSPTPAIVPRKPTAFADASAAERAAEEIIAKYQQEGPSLQSSVKRGCFLYFFIALALLGIGVLVLYLLRTRH